MKTQKPLLGIRNQCKFVLLSLATTSNVVDDAALPIALAILAVYVLVSLVTKDGSQKWIGPIRDEGRLLAAAFMKNKTKTGDKNTVSR